MSRTCFPDAKYQLKGCLNISRYNINDSIIYSYENHKILKTRNCISIQEMLIPSTKLLTVGHNR